MGVLGDFVTGEIITHSPPVKISPGVKLSTDNYSAGGGDISPVKSLQGNLLS